MERREAADERLEAETDAKQPMSVVEAELHARIQRKRESDADLGFTLYNWRRLSRCT